jgi:ribosome-binding factor A
MAYQIGDKYYHNDIESGAMIEVSKETFDALNRNMKLFQDQLNELRKNRGTIVIHSTTADDFDSANECKNIWEDLNNDKNRKP